MERVPTVRPVSLWTCQRLHLFSSLVTALLCSLTTVFNGQAIAEAGRYPKPKGYINDFAEVMDQATVQRLEIILADLEHKTSAEVAVVTLPSVLDGDIERAAAELYKEWGVGKKGKDNGVLILCAVQDRRVRIEVGYGLEAILPDAKAGQVIRDQMVPRFRAGDMSGGLENGVQSIVRMITHATLQPDETARYVQGPVTQNVGWAFWGWRYLTLILWVSVVLFLMRRLRAGRVTDGLQAIGALMPLWGVYLAFKIGSDVSIHIPPVFLGWLFWLVFTVTILLSCYLWIVVMKELLSSSSWGGGTMGGSGDWSGGGFGGGWSGGDFGGFGGGSSGGGGASGSW